MRAIEKGFPDLRAANTGISTVVDAYGMTLAMLDMETGGAIDVRLPRPLPPTPTPALAAGPYFFSCSVREGSSACGLGGKTLDRLQYGAGFAIAFGLSGTLIGIALGRFLGAA